MIRYLLKVKCSTADCVNNENSSELWYDNPEVSHPCGICGMTITECEIIKQAEFQPHPPPPPLPVVEAPSIVITEEVIEESQSE